LRLLWLPGCLLLRLLPGHGDGLLLSTHRLLLHHHTSAGTPSVMLLTSSTLAQHMLLLGKHLLLLQVLLLQLLGLLDHVGGETHAGRTTRADAVAAGQLLFDVRRCARTVTVTVLVTPMPAAFAVEGLHSGILHGQTELDEFLRLHLELIFWALPAGHFRLRLVVGRHTAQLSRQIELLLILNVQALVEDARLALLSERAHTAVHIGLAGSRSAEATHSHLATMHA